MHLLLAQAAHHKFLALQPTELMWRPSNIFNQHLLDHKSKLSSIVNRQSSVVSCQLYNQS